jgi:RNA polymerase sigma factor (sigma-70 family)
MTDTELLNDYVRARNESAFTELVLRYEKLVWSVCYRLLKNHSDREDAFQETFLIFARKAHRIRKPESMSNWLYSVAWKTASRIRKRRVTMSLNDYLEKGNEVPDPSESQLDRITRLNEFERVNRQLQAMPEEHRTPLILFYFSGLTAKQISHQLNLTVAATEGRLRRGREKLRNLSRAGSGFVIENESSGERASAMKGSMLLLLSEAINCQAPSGLVSTVIANSITSTSSVSAGVSNGVLTSGAKLMICKYACAVGITAIFALGGLMHSPAFLGDGQQQTSQMIVTQAAGFAETNAEFVSDSGEATSTCCNSQCCNCVVCPDGCELCDVVCSHLDVVHSSLIVHAQKFCELIGCSCCDGE